MRVLLYISNEKEYSKNMKMITKEETENIIKVNFLGLFDLKWTKKNPTQEKVMLPFFAMHLVEHCNLNCEGCDHCVPLASPEFADIETFKKDFSRLSKLFDNIKVIGLMGGEPLLHPNLPDFFYESRKFFPKSALVLYTNGILLEQQDDKFWDACVKNDIIINVTKYPINLNFERLEQLAKDKNTKFYFSNHPEEKIKTSHKIIFDLEGKQNINESFKQCSHIKQGCTFLAEGKIYPCTVAPTSKNFSTYFNKNLNLSKKDYIDIHKTNNGKKILDFLAKPIPFCRYCDVKNRSVNHPWAKSKKDISEWT